MRRLRKENEDEEKLRLEQSMNRKVMELPSQDLCFDYSGEILSTQKPSLKKELAVQTG